VNPSSTLATLSRTDLQGLAKKNGIPANLSTDKLRERLEPLMAPAPGTPAEPEALSALGARCIGSTDGKTCVYLRDGVCGMSC